MRFLRVWKNHQIIVRWNMLKSLSILKFMNSTCASNRFQELFWVQECWVLTYRGPLPFNVDRNFLAEEERGVLGREIWILKQDSLHETFMSQLLKGFPIWLCVLRLACGHLLFWEESRRVEEKQVRWRVMECCWVFDAETSLTGG